MSDAKEYITGDYYYFDIETAPLNKKLIALNSGGVAIITHITHDNKNDFLGWFPLPRKRKDNGNVEN